MELVKALANAPGNAPYVVAIMIMLAIAAFELITAVIGGGLFSFVDEILDSVLPDLDADLDVDLDISFGSHLLGWLNIGKVPVLVLLVIFLTSFGVAGLFMQQFYREIFSAPLTNWLVSPAAFIATLPVMHYMGALVAAIIPNETTEAVSSETFTGRAATIVMGEARAGTPAQALLVDEYGHRHNVMVEPIDDGVVFKLKEQVVLIEKDHARSYVFKCVRMEGVE